MKYSNLLSVLGLLALHPGMAAARETLPLPPPAIPAPAMPARPPSDAETKTVPAKVLRVLDADTFEIEVEGENPLGLSLRVRVRGMNAPESRSSCGLTNDQIAALPAHQQQEARQERGRLRGAERALAQRATAAARRLIEQSNNRVLLSDYKHDKYGGRINANVTLADGRDFATIMIQRGHADPYDGGKRVDWCGR